MAELDPTGVQTVLRREGVHGEVTAQIAQVGASLRALTVGGVDLVARYPAGVPAPMCSGTVLVPWPNRVADGRWTHDGVTRQLWVTEPDRATAIHGLLRYSPYDIENRGDAATLRAGVFPQAGYPFTLETAVTYELVDDGITVTHEIRNVGDDPAPVAIGTHPFFHIGGADTGDLVLASPVETTFVVDDRLLPQSEVPVTGSFDLRAGQRLRDVDYDTGFGGLVPDEDGRVRSTLTAPDGRVLTIWQDAVFGYLQVFTTTRYPGHPHAVAIEPMTAAIDAFNSGRGLRWLAPGEDWAPSWGATYTA